MKVEVKEFEEKYLKDFEYNGIEKGLLQYYNNNIVLTILDYQKLGEIFVSIVKEDNREKVIGFGGFLKVNDRCLQAWLLINDIKECLKSVIKIIKEKISQKLKEGYIRIQAICLDLPETKAFLEALGFKKEGVLRKLFIDGSDAVMYAIVREE